MMDLDDFDTVAAADSGAVMQVRDPRTNVAGDATLTLLGEDSEKSRKARFAVADRRNKARVAARNLVVSAEEIDADELDVLVDCTIGFSGFSKQGAPLEFSSVNVRALYTRLPWLREQAELFRADRANFMKASR